MKFIYYYVYSWNNIKCKIKLNFITENYILKNDEWKYDVIPEIMDGKNVADFIDPEIEEKLDELEREEERLIAEGYYDSEEEMVYIYFIKNKNNLIIFIK